LFEKQSDRLGRFASSLEEGVGETIYGLVQGLICKLNLTGANGESLGILSHLRFEASPDGLLDFFAPELDKLVLRVELLA